MIPHNTVSYHEPCDLRLCLNFCLLRLHRLEVRTANELAGVRSPLLVLVGATSSLQISDGWVQKVGAFPS